MSIDRLFREGGLLRGLWGFSRFMLKRRFICVIGRSGDGSETPNSLFVKIVGEWPRAYFNWHIFFGSLGGGRNDRSKRLMSLRRGR